MAIKIPIVADVANAIRGARDVGQEFDKVADTLDDLESNAKDAERALDWGTPDSLEKVEDSTKDATDEMKDLERAAEDTGDKLERKFKEAHEQVEKLGKEDVNIEVDIDKDRKARESFDNLKEDIGDSANESGQEVAGAFMDGFSGENIVEALTEVLAESTENLSGPFQAAGIAAAAGLALVYAQLAKIAEETNEAKEAGGEWAQSFNTTDLSGRLDALRDKFAAFAT